MTDQEINDEIAIKLFGWKWLVHDVAVPNQGRRTVRSLLAPGFLDSAEAARINARDYIDVDALPVFRRCECSFSTDPSTILNIIDAMRARGWSFVIHGPSRSVGGYSVAFIEDRGDYCARNFRAWNESLLTAICEAALKTLDEEAGGPLTAVQEIAAAASLYSSEMDSVRRNRGGPFYSTRGK